MPIFAWNVSLRRFSEEISSLSHSTVFLYFFFFCSDHWGRLSSLSLLFFGTLHSDGYIFHFLFAVHFFSQLCVRPPQTAVLPFCIYFSWGWSRSLPPVQCHEPDTAQCHEPVLKSFTNISVHKILHFCQKESQGNKRYFPWIPVRCWAFQKSPWVGSYFKCRLILRSVMGSLFHLGSQKLWYCCGIIIIPHFKVFLWNHFFHLGSKMSAKLMMCGCPMAWEAWRLQTENMATVQERCLVPLDIWKATLFIEVCEFCKSQINSLLLSWRRNGLKYK